MTVDHKENLTRDVAFFELLVELPQEVDPTVSIRGLVKLKLEWEVPNICTGSVYRHSSEPPRVHLAPYRVVQTLPGAVLSSVRGHPVARLVGENDLGSGHHGTH